MTPIKVTPAQFGTLPSKLAVAHEKAVMTATANSGTIVEGGTTASFSYTPSTGILDVSVTKHSLFSLDATHAEKGLVHNIERVLAA